jgi:hypothetical protein
MHAPESPRTPWHSIPYLQSAYQSCEAAIITIAALRFSFVFLSPYSDQS